LYVVTYWPVQRVSSSTMRERAPFAITTSFSTSASSARSGLPLRCRCTRSFIRAESVARPASTASSVAYMALCGTSVMKPRLPMFTPRMGAGRPPSRPAAWMSVPSPPSTTTRSAPVATSSSFSSTSTPLFRRNWAT
jgi:hypothetical protein